jgi:hypothetical protein
MGRGTGQGQALPLHVRGFAFVGAYGGDAIASRDRLRYDDVVHTRAFV